MRDLARDILQANGYTVLEARHGTAEEGRDGTVTVKRDEKPKFGGPQPIRREDDGRLAKERRMRSWVHRVLKEDLGEKVTEAEWTLLWLAAETKIALDGMRPKQRHGKTGMRLQMHLVKIVGGLRRGRGHR